MGYKFQVKGKAYQFPSVQDLVAASALIHAAYDRGEAVSSPFTHNFHDSYTGDWMGAIDVQLYIEGSFHIWMVAGYVVYTRMIADERKIA